MCGAPSPSKWCRRCPKARSDCRHSGSISVASARCSGVSSSSSTFVVCHTACLDNAKHCIVGCKALRRQSPFSHPKTCVDRRVLHPRVATKNKWLRIEMLSRNKRFQQRYRDAFLRRRAGKVDALFPYGSYQLRVLGLVRCEPPPPG